LEFCASLDNLFLDDEQAKEILSTTQFEKKVQNVRNFLLLIFIYDSFFLKNVKQLIFFFQKFVFKEP